LHRVCYILITKDSRYNMFIVYYSINSAEINKAHKNTKKKHANTYGNSYKELI